MKGLPAQVSPHHPDGHKQVQVSSSGVPQCSHGGHVVTVVLMVVLKQGSGHGSGHNSAKTNIGALTHIYRKLF